MTIDLTGITNKNEYYTNHYFATVFEGSAEETIRGWTAEAKESDELHTPWSMLRKNARQYYVAHDKYVRSSINLQTLAAIKSLANLYLNSLGYPEAKPESIIMDDVTVPVFLEMNKSNGAPLLWVILSASRETDAGIMESFAFSANDVEEEAAGTLFKGILGEIPNEDLVTKILFSTAEPPRFVMLIGMNQIALIDRNKWNEKRYLQFELEEIFSRMENSTLQAMSVLLHRESLCPEDGKILLDELDEQSQKHTSGVSQDLKYALRESIELLGNEVLYDMRTRLGRDLETNPVDASQLTLECLRYMYRMLFVLFIEARPELGYAQIKAQSYYAGYSLESLRDIADNIRDDVEEVGDGYYLHETLAKLYKLIYEGYPKTEEELKEAISSGSLHDMFFIAPLKAHIFDPEYTQMVTNAKLRNSCMLRIIDLMSLTKSSGKKNERRGRISYANLGINQMGAVYEALLSYRGFIAEYDLYEVKRAEDKFDELDVGYFVSEPELDQYTEEERVRYEKGENKGKLRMYAKGTFIYRLAGREREKSASYYTPEVLTKCLVKYALKEMLEGKTADEILELTVCEPAMGSAAFLNEAINQLAEAYISRKEQETGEIISYDKRFNELQKVKMYIADRNVYGIDLNPVAVELAEVSLWLNTIHEGGFVPWFGTQLVNGNSLIGARRQCYRTESLTTATKGLRWYENEPERVPLGTKRMPKKQIYHFLLGDIGMCSYNDKVIKSLEPDNIKAMSQWNKNFTKPYTDDDISTLLRLSATIDNLWDAQINLRKEVNAKTQDNLSVFGHVDDTVDSHTTIRQKDKIFRELYKSEHMRNAGPYARLKFAMNYWCALWFWPIEKADLLPNRSEFLFDMSLILEGTMESIKVVDKSIKEGQLSLFPNEVEQLALDIIDTYGMDTVVDIPRLRQENPRLDLAAQIAEQNKFMHWELEFADLFAERGGFDLIIGNPPWVKMEWDETGALSDKNPSFAIKNMKATEIANHRKQSLMILSTKQEYFGEYQSMSGQQAFLGAKSNYPDISGAINLYKCFLPQAWQYGKGTGISAFVHPDGVFDDPKGGLLRQKLYTKIKKHFHFVNEMKLFAEVDHHMGFSLNVYSNIPSSSFDMICNLYVPSTIDECLDPANRVGPVPGIKDENGSWCTVGHYGRLITVGKKELILFARLFDDSDNWKEARIPAVHAKALSDVLYCFSQQQETIFSSPDATFTTEMWNETGAQKDGTIVRDVHIPESNIDLIYSGPHIGVANPIFKASRTKCVLNSDYDNIDLTTIGEEFRQRCNYSPAISVGEYLGRVPHTPWGTQYTSEYRLVMRKMLNLSGERALIPAIIPKGSGHIDGLFGIANKQNLAFWAACLASVPYDYLIKASGKSNCRNDLMSKISFPKNEGCLAKEMACRALLLNCLDKRYTEFWHQEYDEVFSTFCWTKRDFRLCDDKFSNLSAEWTRVVPLRSDFERRQALIEIDVLTAMSIGMSLDQLKTIYRIQFPVLQQYESNTWYDANGRIVFTTNRSLVGVGFDRKTWEYELKDAPAGKKFYREISDDTMPGGPVERTIEYVAPFTRCDREKDYETAWKFFEKKYKEDKRG